MIYFSPPFLSFNGLTIFKDNLDPLQFYYFPQQPVLALNPDGTPSFLFVKYRADLQTAPAGSEPGGGFLNFDVDMHVPDGIVTQTIGQIKEAMKLSATPRLVPIDFRRGTTRLIFLDAVDPTTVTTGPTPAPVPQSAPAGTPDASGAAPAAPPPMVFVEKASYEASPSLYGDNRAAFSVQLTAEGATLVEETLDAPTSLIGIVYNLTFVGMRPAFQIDAKIDWNRVYDDVESDFSAGVHIFCFGFDTDIQNEVQKLIEQQVIQLNVISDAAGAADADIESEKNEAVAFVEKFIADTFFQPSIPVKGQDSNWGSDASSLVNSLMPVHAGYTYKHMTRDDVKNLSIDFTEESATEMNIVPQGHLEGLLTVLQNYPRDQYVKEIDLNDPFFQTVAVDVIGGDAMTADNIDHIAVHLEYGAVGQTVPQDVILSAAGVPSHVQWALIQAVGLSYTYQYHVYFKTSSPPGLGTDLLSQVFTTNATKLIIDPRDLYGVQSLDIESVNMPWDRYAQVEVALKYTSGTFTLQDTVMLTANQLTGSWVYRINDPTQTSYQYQLTFYPTGGSPIVQEWVTTSVPAVLVTDPLPSTLSVTMFPTGDFTKIMRIMATMNYEDDANGINETDLVIFNQPSDQKNWSVHIVNVNNRQYSYQVSVQYRDGTTKQFPPVPSTARMLFISDTFSVTNQVAISATGASFSDANLTKVTVALSYDDNANNLHDQQTFTLTSTTDTFGWKYLQLDPTLGSYQYQISYYTTDGFNRTNPQLTASTQTIVVPITAAS